MKIVLTACFNLRNCGLGYTDYRFYVNGHEKGLKKYIEVFVKINENIFTPIREPGKMNYYKRNIRSKKPL